MKKIHLLLIPLLITLVVSIMYRSRVFDMDQAIITHGIRAATRYREIANISAIITVIIAVVYLLLLLIGKVKNKRARGSLSEFDKKESFEREVDNILSKLREVAKASDSERVRNNADATIGQVYKIDKYIDRFKNLYIGENVDVFDRVAESLDQAKGQLIQNSKSIVNRISIEGCEDEIEKRVDNNQKIIDDAKVLLNETVNYLDNKTTTSNSPLENITSSLKILNETIGESF